MTSSDPQPSNAASPASPDEEPIVYGDDAVIGRAVRISLIGVAGVGALTAAVWFMWPKPPPAAPPGDTKVTGPATRELPKAPQGRALPFTRITEAAGIDFQRTDGADGRKLLPETMGGGVALADFDGNGTLDLAFADGAAWPDAPKGTGAGADGGAASKAGRGIVLYLNDGTAKFTQITDTELGKPGQYMGLATADIDADGRMDMLVTGVGGLRLLRNTAGPDGTPVFVDITKDAGLSADDGWSTSAGFADTDKDGDLDLIVLHYVKWSPEIDAQVDYKLAGIGRAYGPPTGFPGAQTRLYEQVGPMRFADRTAERGLVVNTADLSKPGAKGEPAGKALGLAIDDLDSDGDLDLLVANDKVRKFLYVNDGKGNFAERGIELGFAFDRAGAATGAMGIDVARLRSDGVPFVVIGNFANEPSGLYSAPKGTLRFTDDAIVEGLSAASRPYLKFGMLLADLDLDGRPDLVQANGHIEDQIARAQAHQSYRQRTQVFVNTGGKDGQGVLLEVPPASTGDLTTPLVGRGAGWGDLDGDGDLDLVVTQTVGAPAVFRNEAPHTAAQWVGIRLQQPGANRDAIGAVVETDGPDGTQQQTIMPVRSYLTSVPPEAWFGVPAGEGPVEITVRWPDGTVQKESVLRGTRSTLKKQ